jgi:hypothetical protein
MSHFLPNRLGVVVKSSGAPTLPAPSLSLTDPLSTSGSGGTLRPSAPPSAQHGIEFYEDVVYVSFDGAKFNAQPARYFVV